MGGLKAEDSTPPKTISSSGMCILGFILLMHYFLFNEHRKQRNALGAIARKVPRHCSFMMATSLCPLEGGAGGAAEDCEIYQ